MIIASLYAAFLVLVTVFGVHSPINSIEWLTAASDNLDAMRLTLAGLILAGAFIPAAAHAKQILFGGISISLGLLLMGNFMLSESFQGLGLQFYTLDLIALAEGIIITALLRARATEADEEEIFDMFTPTDPKSSNTI